MFANRTVDPKRQISTAAIALTDRHAELSPESCGIVPEFTQWGKMKERRLMSGKRQHFIPQFLQRGFASHTDGDEVFTWVYRKGVNPFNTNIKNSSVESSFYTHDGDTTVDDSITEVESALSDLVQDLRTAPCGRVSNPNLPTLVAHLEVRTRHLRQSFSIMSAYMFSRIIDRFSDPDFFPWFVEQKLREDPAMIQEMLSEDLAKRGFQVSEPEVLSRLMWFLLPVMKPQLQQTIPRLAAYLEANFLRRIPEAAKSGHIRALTKSVSPEPKVQQYKDLLYSVVAVPDGSLILGDSSVIFRVDGPRAYKSFKERHDILRAIFLPLSPQRVLVGTYSPAAMLIPDLREAIARSSLEHFIAHDTSQENNLLRSYIGTNAYLLSERQIDAIVSEVFGEHRKGQSQADSTQ